MKNFRQSAQLVMFVSFRQKVRKKICFLKDPEFLRVTRFIVFSVLVHMRIWNMVKFQRVFYLWTCSYHPFVRG